jgi:hypothetical protein
MSVFFRLHPRKLALVAVVALAQPAWAACCYFAAKDKDINQPGQKAFLTWVPAEKVESFTVQPKFEGNALDFGMVIPTPSRPKLDEMPRDFFKDLAIYTILMPLPQQIWLLGAPDLNGNALGGGGGGGVYRRSRAVEKDGVTVLESGVVGSLDYKIIVAENASGLYDWLKENNYNYGGDAATLDFYLKKKWFFTVMKIDSKAMKKAADGSYQGEITPTRFTFESEQCIYPLKITQLSVKDKTDALFYVQSSKQMDLTEDLSWMHSWRVMYLTYSLGCSANPEEQKELTERNAWVAAKKKADPRFETTKLEWARKLGDAEVDLLEAPLERYAQMGNQLPAGATVISHETFLAEAKAELEKAKTPADQIPPLVNQLDVEYPAGKGQIVKNMVTGRFAAPYMWYPNREAPADDVKGLARLKGHLQKNKWLTKLRKVIRKDEMTDDLVFVPVAEGKEQDYVRILPTSPP